MISHRSPAPLAPSFSLHRFFLAVALARGRRRTLRVVADDPALAYVSGDPNEAQSPAMAAAAMSTGAGATTYGIDYLLGVFVRITDASTGQVTTVGSTGVTTAPCAALDFAADGVWYASMTTSGVNNLYTMNLSTGAATLLGPIDIVSSVQSIAIPN